MSPRAPSFKTVQRYTVTIVATGDLSERPTLVVPFEPSATVTAFIEDLWKSIARLDVPLAPNSHICRLHIDSTTGKPH